MAKGRARVAQAYTLTDHDVARFWAKVAKSDDCWPWLGSIMASGYGQFHIRLEVNRWSATVAHRVAYEISIGPIPSGLVLDHLCRVRHCVRPDHLEPTTDAVNILRGTGWAARHARKTHCPAGHPYDQRNTHVDKKGMRHCRACSAIRQAARRRRLAE